MKIATFAHLKKEQKKWGVYFLLPHSIIQIESQKHNLYRNYFIEDLCKKSRFRYLSLLYYIGQIIK